MTVRETTGRSHGDGGQLTVTWRTLLTNYAWNQNFGANRKRTDRVQTLPDPAGCERTDALVRLRRTGSELEHVGSLVPQTPAVQDLAVTLLEVVELQHVGGVQQSAQRK